MGNHRISLDALKFTPPDLPATIPRPRLYELLDTPGNRRVAFIFGQAGQGKTTLIASYLKQSDIPSAWIRLEGTEMDTAGFFRLVTRALDHALHANGPRTPVDAPPGAPPGARTPAKALSHSTKTALPFSRVSRPFNLIIDGAERLLDDGARGQLLEAMAAGMAEAPDRSRLFILSRTIATPRVQRCKVRQDALVISNEELAFTREETRSFFLDLHDVSLDSDSLSRAHETAEGWAGGLVLLSKFLKGPPRGAAPGPADPRLQGSPWEQWTGEALRYFSEEIFEAESEEIRAFLIRSCVFGAMDPMVMKCLMGSEEVDQILWDLVKRHVFIRSFYTAEKGWLFRYHGLFRDFLKTVFQSRLSERERRSLLARAGALFMERKDWTRGIRFHLEAGEFERAASAMERVGTDLLRQEKYADLSRWIDALPDELIEREPWPRYFFAMTRRRGGGLGHSEDLTAALDLFKAGGDIRGQMLALAGLMESSLFTDRDPDLAPSWINQGEALIRSLESVGAFFYEKAALLLRIGWGRITGDGDLRKGVSACENARVLAGRLEDDALLFDALAASTFGLTWAGDFKGASRVLEKMGRFDEDKLPPGRRAIRRIVSMDLAMNQGDFARARESLHACRDEIEAHGLVFLHPAHLYVEGMLNIHQGRFHEAGRIGNQLADFAARWNCPYHQGAALQLLCVREHHRGAFEKALNMGQKALGVFAGTKQGRLHDHRTRETMGMIHYHLGNYPAAGKALGEALSFFKAVSSRASAAETHLAIGLLQWARKDRDGARAHLGKGLAIAKRKNYVFAPMMRPRDFMNACLLAVELGMEECMDQAAHLLATRLAPLAGPELERLSKSEPAQQRVTRRIMGTIHRANLPRLRIVTFGGFHVFRGDGAPMEERAWGGGRPKLLLKAIIAHGIREIPKDLLIDELWPDSPGSAAGRSFKVNLHRLRKALEPGLTPVLGSSYIHLKDNLVSLDPELCRVDLDAFLVHRREAGEAAAAGDARRALALHQRASEIYQGPFLAEELYAPWAEMKREELKQAYVEVLCAMAELHERRGASRKATAGYTLAIKTDPYLERAHQRLMTLHFNRGMRAAALKVYEDFKAALGAGIGAEPDAVTTSIYRKILESS
ncbi:MAG: hypothetical protein GY859_25995 [Desulfobacterales bacterium]|nr:hypothetical protein [Desulfobacterales bacterium]